VIGLGCMRLTNPSVLQAAIAGGLTHLDTADVYGPTHTDLHANEGMVAAAATEDCTVVTKVGFVRPPTGRWTPDGRAKHLRDAALQSVEVLGRVDQLLLHFPDPKRKLGTSLRALAKLQKEGLVAGIGVCNVTLAQLREAMSLVELTSIQVPLSVHNVDAVRGGVVGAALAAGLQVQAHSPFGGPKGHKKVGRDVTLKSIATELGCSPYAVALAALADVGVVPLAGPTRMETLEATLQAQTLDLAAHRPQLHAAFPALSILTNPDRRPAQPNGQEVVVFVGMPGSGKSTAAQELVDAGYERLNRDERGGTLKKLLPPLKAALAEGKSVVLDNTYASRARRNELVELAWQAGGTARCVHFVTDRHDCQINAMWRMLERYGRLEGDKGDPQAFGPMALGRWQRGFEVPELNEGFESIDERAFVRRPWHGEGAILLDANAPDQPGIRLGECPHGGGIPRCWCRPPLPGLLLVALHEHTLDPTKCRLVTDNPKLRQAATRLGIPESP
jgi:aryl-alcohol dehydrogenase-like predicted oxidoreductase